MSFPSQLNIPRRTAVELAGDRMVIKTEDDGTMSVNFDDKGTGRVCGSCQLCCRLMPIPPLRKPAMTRCQHQSFAKGCKVHHHGKPVCCKTFACLWLADPETKGMPRPDRAHYVLDMTADYVTHTDLNTGEKHQLPVFQVWADPAFRNAHRAPELRAWMMRQAERFGAGTIVRYSITDAIAIFPPAFNADGEWKEIVAPVTARTFEDREIMSNFAGGTP